MLQASNRKVVFRVILAFNLVRNENPLKYAKKAPKYAKIRQNTLKFAKNTPKNMKNQGPYKILSTVYIYTYSFPASSGGWRPSGASLMAAPRSGAWGSVLFLTERVTYQELFQNNAKWCKKAWSTKWRASRAIFAGLFCCILNYFGVTLGR